MNSGLAWELSSANALALDPTISKGYQVRDNAVKFELPFVMPKLASGDDILAHCGPVEYDISIASSKNDGSTAAFSY